MATPEPRLEYVLVSDVHLCEVAEGQAAGWWTYKRAKYRQDRSLAGFLEALQARRPDYFDATELIFNGDSFDFDLVFSHPDGAKGPSEGLPPSIHGSVYKLRRILSDHPMFVAALARFLAAGNRATFVMGNHDRELWFSEVQAVLREAVAAAAPPGGAAVAVAGLRFEPWFVYKPGILYAEHGQQYDATCSYRDVLDPAVPADRNHGVEIETPFGGAIGRHTLCRFGTFNPFNDESFILSAGGYAKHWARHYFPRRRFLSAYSVGVWRAVREMRGRRRRLRLDAPARAERRRRYARDKGVSDAFIADLERLSSPPIVDRMRLLSHELWLDRFAVVFLAIGLIAAGLVMAKTLGQGLLMLSLIPALLIVIRAMGRGSLALQERARWGLVADEIANSLKVPIVAFGHSHRPERRPLTGGGRYYNLGSWAPVTEADRGSSLWRARRYLIVRPGAGGDVHVVFARWPHEQDHGPTPQPAEAAGA